MQNLTKKNGSHPLIIAAVSSEKIIIIIRAAATILKSTVFFLFLPGILVFCKMCSQKPQEFATFWNENGNGQRHQHPSLDKNVSWRIALV